MINVQSYQVMHSKFHGFMSLMMFCRILQDKDQKNKNKNRSSKDDDLKKQERFFLAAVFSPILLEVMAVSERLSVSIMHPS